MKYCSDEHRAKAWRFAQRARRANIAAHALAALAVNQLYLVLMQQDPTTVAALTQDAHLVAKGRSPGQLEIPVP